MEPSTATEQAPLSLALWEPDDDSRNRTVHLLAQLGFHVHGCRDAAGLFQWLDLRDPDLVLVGAGAPVKQVVDAVLPRLSAHYGAGILVQAPDAARQTRLSALQAGAHLCLDRRYEAVELAALLRAQARRAARLRRRPAAGGAAGGMGVGGASGMAGRMAAGGAAGMAGGMATAGVPGTAGAVAAAGAPIGVGATGVACGLPAAGAAASGAPGASASLGSMAGVGRAASTAGNVPAAAATVHGGHASASGRTEAGGAAAGSAIGANATGRNAAGANAVGPHAVGPHAVSPHAAGANAAGPNAVGLVGSTDIVGLLGAAPGLRTAGYALRGMAAAGDAGGRSLPPREPWRVLYQGWVLITPAGKRIHLTGTERACFICLLDNPKRELSRAAMSEFMTATNLRSVNVAISRLRKKVQESGERLPLHTVHGMGYVFVGDLTVEE